MASAIVRTSIHSAIQNTPSQSPRSLNLRDKAQEIITKGSVEEVAMEKFSEEILTYLRDQVRSVAEKYKGMNKKREKLWSMFHKIRMGSKLSSLWINLMGKLGIVIEDPLLEQSFYQNIFEVVIKEYFECSRSESTARSKADSISPEELNVLRYACGYVALKLQKCYEKMHGDIAQQYVTCLSEMAVDGEGNDLLDYTKRWLELVNRGGLFPLSDEAFRFFVEIEICVRTYLPQQLLKPSSEVDFTENVHDKVFCDEDVQFHWTLLSQHIQDSESSDELLKEIIKLWITIRGFSITGYWMELYKEKEKNNIKKSRGLRKSVSRECED